jgi:7-cyano-7-deazaguanine synthase
MATSRAVVMFSGGLDSAVCLALAGWDYAEVHALSVYYGQRHTIELQYAAELAKRLGVRWRKVTIDPCLWKQVPLVAPPSLNGSEPPDTLEGGRSIYAIRDGGIPRSVVPGRNAVFLSHAIALAEILGGADVLFGANLDDARGFIDCRPAAVAAYDQLARATTEGRVQVRAPLLFCRKRSIAWLALRCGLDPAVTWSCYRPRTTLEGAVPCGTCDACAFRADALAHPEPLP